MIGLDLQCKGMADRLVILDIRCRWNDLYPYGVWPLHKQTNHAVEYCKNAQWSAKTPYPCDCIWVFSTKNPNDGSLSHQFCVWEVPAAWHCLRSRIHDVPVAALVSWDPFLRDESMLWQSEATSSVASHVLVIRGSVATSSSRLTTNQACPPLCPCSSVTQLISSRALCLVFLSGCADMICLRAGIVLNWFPFFVDGFVRSSNVLHLSALNVL